MAVTCVQIWAYDDKEALDDVHQLATTTVPEPAVEEEATALPAEGLQGLGDGVALINKATALPETTNPSVETTVPTTTATTTTEAQKETDLSPFPTYQLPSYPQPHPYGYGFPFPHPNIGRELKPISERSTETPSTEASYAGYPGYPYPSFPILRPPFSPYGSPPYPYPLGRSPYIPGFAPGLGDGAKPEKGKPVAPDASDKGKENANEEAPKPPVEPPSFGYPPVYLIPRRFPYARNIGGYGAPYGYGR